MIKYSDLTEYHKSVVTNGCGGKGGFINPPNFIFKASCNQHDFYYWRGKDEEDRKKADNAFYRYMKIDISEASFYKKPYYHLWAFTYYSMVRLFGKKYFFYSSKYKTLDDLF